VTLSNNTDSSLTLLGSNLCGGDWTNGAQWAPPTQIPKKTHGAWQSESGGIGTGTEGWVKYLVENDTSMGCLKELVFIHWNNPFVWDSGTTPMPEWTVTTSDVPTPCDAEGGGSTFSELTGGRSPSQACRHELFGASASGGDQGGITWWDVVVNWPALLGLTLAGQMDINLEFTLGLRQEGSVEQTIFSFHDGRAGLRSLATAAGKSSLRQLFHFKH
jgi:hypothetical protein